MKRGVEVLIVLVGCALVYSQMRGPKVTPTPSAATPSGAVVSSIDPIPPPAGVKLYSCEHYFENEKAQALFSKSQRQEGEDAAKTLRQAISLEPGNAVGHYHLAIVEGIDPAERIQAATRALELQPGFAKAWNARASARAVSTDRKQLELGLEDVRHGLGLEDGAPYHDTRGYLLMCLGRPQEALYDVERAVRDDATDADYLLHRAAVYEALGRKQEADQDTQQARTLGHP